MYTILDLNFSGDLDYFEEAFTIKLFFVSITLRQFIARFYDAQKSIRREAYEEKLK